MADTFARSSEHWSEDKRAGMEDFYTLAWFDYRQLAEAHDWTDWLARLKPAERALRVLDVGCGAAKFPVALARDAGVAAVGEIELSLLDPSAFSIEEARRALIDPFRPGPSFHMTAQALDAPPGAFDAAWAVHALYALPVADLDEAIARVLSAATGPFFIGHAASRAHYLTFYRHYLADFSDGERAPYTSAEEIEAALTRAGVPFTVKPIAYQNTAPADQRAQVEGFLQRCVFDDGVSLDDLERGPNTGPYLEGCRDGSDGAWHFHQDVHMIFVRS